MVNLKEKDKCLSNGFNKKSLLKSAVILSILSIGILSPSISHEGINSNIAYADKKSDIEDKISEFQVNLQKLNGKIEASQHKLNELSKEKESLDKESKELSKEISLTKKEIDKIQKDLDNKMIALQLTKDQNNLVSSILKNKSLTSFIQNRESLSQIQSQGNDLKDVLTKEQSSLAEKEAALKANSEKIELNIKEEKEISESNEKDKLKIEKEMKDNKSILLDLEKREQEALSKELQEKNKEAELIVKSNLSNNNDTPKSVPKSNTGNAMVDEAYKYLGVPYSWGGTDPSIGLDCSGLTLLVANNVGKSLPRTSQDQQVSVTPVPLSDVQPGDLVFFGYPAYHVGIYIGDGNYIHAPEPGDVVKITNKSYFSYTSAGRI